MTGTRRPRRILIATIALVLGSLTVAPLATAMVVPDARPSSQTAPTALTAGQLTVVRVTGGLSSPLGVVNAGDGSNRLFIVERGGKVRVVSGGVLRSAPFLDIGSRTTPGGERGLLGLAFHPDFGVNGHVYLYYTAADGDIVLSRVTANAARTSASLTTEKVLLRVEHSANTNHNGGAMAFGPDGYLYIGTGDGGGSGDPLDNAQDITNEFLGKILRIDVDGTGHGVDGVGYGIPSSNPFVGTTGDDEIWAYGLRNPWRISFDRTSGDLYIADVGQSRREEVNLEDVDDVGGNDYGWNVMEGSLCYSPSSGCDTSGTTLPVAQYDHSLGCSITGGYVYRGAHRDLQGLYVYGDFCSGRLWTMAANGTGETVRRDTNLSISSFGESEAGELFLTDLGGTLYRVIAPEFSDIATSSYIDHIHWLFYAGITGGCGGTRFCPTDAVTRGQMASFLARVLDLPAATTDHFDDDDGKTHEADINRLAEAGITGGCGERRFCATRVVTRAQMAAFIARARSLPPATTDHFDDDDGTTHEADINRLAEAGITGGCAVRRYCPTAAVTREQMATFLRRAFPNPS
jgi:glucose/arabinose dehydrogenase